MKGSLRLDGAAVRFWLSRRQKCSYDLARAADATESFVSRAICGHVGVTQKVVEAFADELGVTVDHLLSGTAPLRIAAVAS